MIVRVPPMLCIWGTSSSIAATVVRRPHDICADIVIYRLHLQPHTPPKRIDERDLKIKSSTQNNGL